MYTALRWNCAAMILGLAACTSPAEEPRASFAPTEVIDLGALVTEDLPQRVWGAAFMKQMGFDRGNSFEVIKQPYEGDLSVSNSYYTLFNHGGPHVDAPNHVSVGEGLDSYPVDAFFGPLRVLDVSNFEAGRTVPRAIFEDAGVAPGDIVLLYTGYVPPRTDQDVPQVTTLTLEAAEYLAALPVRAVGTDAFSVFTLSDSRQIQSEDPVVRIAPIHHAFLSHGIPIYEQLQNVDQLIGHERMLFVGQPLNIEDGDGMMVRPLVFVY